MARKLSTPSSTGGEDGVDGRGGLWAGPGGRLFLKSHSLGAGLVSMQSGESAIGTQYNVIFFNISDRYREGKIRGFSLLFEKFQ